jgi:L-gulonolactone oxidase
MHRLDRIISADWQHGVVRAEAGMSIDTLLELAVPEGWFLPVTPGTKFVTLGGAVANDVHGKNHEIAGSFGNHVSAIGLLRSNGDFLELSPERDPPMFRATIGGLGLTGVILWVELKLQAIASSFFETETLKFRNLDDFFARAEQSSQWPYTVAWVDCLARGPLLGRGLLTRGQHVDSGDLRPHSRRRFARIPVDAPAALLSGPLVRSFNRYYANRLRARGVRRVHYESFLYPLDSVEEWNRLYGRRGFFQHHSVIPQKTAPKALQKLLEMTSASGQGCFLVVLKLFGSESPGLLSFPMKGATFALDLPNRGPETIDLLARMAEVVVEAGGRLYPAKDATMSGDVFRTGYPRWRDLESMRDPAFMSDFWRRVTA